MPMKQEHLIRHICEVCGKEEILTPDEAYEKGWDYPPRMGVFGVVSPRKCGNCGIDKTLWWAIAGDKKGIEDLTPAQIKTLERILGEPDSVFVIGATYDDGQERRSAHDRSENE